MPDLVLVVQSASLAVLLALSAFFSMSETALISTDRVKLRSSVEKGDKPAALVTELLDQPERILTTVLIGNNIVNIAAASLATVIAIRLWGSAGAAIATGALTFLILVFAEITPKTFAVRNALRLSRVVARPLQIIDRVLRPVVYLLTAVATLLLRPFGIKHLETSQVTQEDIEMMVRVGHEEGEIEQFEKEVISELLDFTEDRVIDVVTPRHRVVTVGHDATLDQALEVIRASGHSRIPVVEGDFDTVLGFIHAKDLLRFSDTELTNRSVQNIIRPVLTVEPGMPPHEAFVQMQRERKLLAVVRDEKGRNAGIATVEDLLEELVGEIHDEFDRH